MAMTDDYIYMSPWPWQVTVSVNPWEVEQPVDPMPHLRHSSFCVVPEGKIGSYGHRSLMALMMGCVPLLTKELYSFNFFHEERPAPYPPYPTPLTPPHPPICLRFCRP